MEEEVQTTFNEVDIDELNGGDEDESTEDVTEEGE